jgi:hypothetical protein
MYTKDDVAKLVGEVGELKLDPPLEVSEPISFGLQVDLFDPVSGHILTLCRPQRADIGQSEILLTAAQVGAAVAGMRIAKLHADRAAGILPPAAEAKPAEQPAAQPVAA